MAKKRGRRRGEPNKSAAIRDYLNANPSAMPKEVVEGLKTQGIEVASALVSNIKNQLKNKGANGAPKTPGAKRGPKPKNAAPSSDLTLDHLFTAKEWVAQIGGIDAAKRAIEALAALTGPK